MSEFAEALKSAMCSLPGSVKVLNTDCSHIDLLNALRECRIDVIPSADGLISIVQESGDPADYSRQSGYFDLHKDGLYYPTAPHFLLLYCENPGRGDSPTVVVDTRSVVEEIERRPELRILEQVELVYRGKTGDEHARPLLERHPLCGWRILNLGSRAYIRPAIVSDSLGISPSLRDVTVAMTEIFRLLDKATVLIHFWSKGDLLLIDNHTYLHGRSAKELDYQRKLLRVWLSLRDGGRP